MGFDTKGDNSLGDYAGDAWNWLKDRGGDALKQVGLGGATTADESKMNNLNAVGGGALGFAGTAQGNYNAFTGQGMQSLAALRALAEGKNSVSAEQLRQGMQQGVSAQHAMAAGASPQNAAMAARNASNNMSRLSYGLSGQQAVAGLAERNQAQQAYANMLAQLRGQDLQGTLGGYNAATGAYSGGLNGQRDPTMLAQWSPIVAGAMKAI